MLLFLALTAPLVHALAAEAPPPSAIPGNAPVLYADDANVAVTRVAADSGQPVWELLPVRITEKLTGGLPRAVGEKQPPSCAAVPTANASVRDAVMRAEGAVSYQKWAQATADLAMAASALACLNEPAEASLASRLMFLQGITLAATGKTDEATAKFVHATFFQPSLAWDDTFSPDFRPAYDKAIADAPKRLTGNVVLGPGVAGATTLWVDGRMATVTGDVLALPTGLHLVQILQPACATVMVSVSASHPVALLVPLQTPDKLVAAAGDVAQHPLLNAIIEQSFPGKAVYVWTGSRTWRVTPSAGSGSEGAAFPGAAARWEQFPVARSVSEAGRKKVGGALRVAGAVAAGIGAVSIGTGLVVWATNESPGGVETDAEWARRTGTAGGGSALFTSGLVSVGLGAVAIGLSFPLGG